MPRPRKTATATTRKKKESGILEISKGVPLGHDWGNQAKASTLGSRRGRSSTIVRTDRFKNIDDIDLPFKKDGKYLTAKQTINLCRKAYFGFGILRNIIDIMTEFSVDKIHLKGGSKDSQKFFRAWLKKINSHNIQEQWYRGYYREGQVVMHRVNLMLKNSGAKSLARVLGQQDFTVANNKKLPIRYVFINPEDLVCSGDISFDQLTYEKILSDYEIQRLRKPVTERDKEFLESIPKSIRENLKSRSIGPVAIPLPLEDTLFSFYKKQDYEPFGVPMAFPVLESINFKKELLQIDMAVARTQQQMILLVTTGAEPEKGGINQDNLRILGEMFKNETVGRTIIADYTTDVKFIIPEIGNILTEDKYKIVERDINIGLNNILLGEEKFANQSVKVEVFLARLEHGREIFLNEILIPEFKRIAKEFGLKNYPMPYYKDIAVKKEIEQDKIFVRLAELGVLTPDETISAIEEGVFPEREDSRKSQKEFSSLRKKEMYVPINKGAGPQTGRPAGAKAPQSTKKVGRIGASEDEDDALFSATRIAEVLKGSTSLEGKIQEHLKEKFSRKKLTQKQQEVAGMITKTIMASEPENKWDEAIAMYCEKPVKSNSVQISEIDALASFFDVDRYFATILYHSRL